MKYQIISYFNENTSEYSDSIIKKFPKTKKFIGSDKIISLLSYLKKVLFPIIIAEDKLASDIPKDIPLIVIDFDSNELESVYYKKKLFQKRSADNTWIIISDEKKLESIRSIYQNITDYKIININDSSELTNKIDFIVNSFYITFYYSILISGIKI